VPDPRRLIVFSLILLVAAVGSFACNDATPAGPSPSGATVTGSLVADRSLTGATVAVAGTNLSAFVDASQRFTIRGVPAGDVRLLFSGPALNGAIDLKGVQPFETVALVVRVSGSTVTLESDQRHDDDPSTCPLAGSNVNENLDLVGDCLITGHVNGNIKISNGTLIVDGSVDGNIEHSGSGGVTVGLGGSVDGNIKEKGAGSVIVSGTVNGKIEEEDDGGVLIAGPGHAKGDVIEKGPGDVEVHGLVDGNVEESESGSVVGTGIVKGNVKESGPGGIAPGLTVNGNREDNS
jgi:cytoskeletal protein CcmA (bactofilin family)